MQILRMLLNYRLLEKAFQFEIYLNEPRARRHVRDQMTADCGIGDIWKITLHPFDASECSGSGRDLGVETVYS